MESPIDIVLFIIILWKKKNLRLISKNYFDHYIGHVEESLNPMLCLW
jgi:hypothetical protein